MGDRQQVVLIVPCQVLTWNRERKINHFARAALVKEARQAAFFVASDWLNKGGRPFPGAVTVQFRPMQGKGVLADTAAHGPSCKAVLDGLVDARLIVADDPRWVLSQTYFPPTKHTRDTGIVVTVMAEL